MTGSPSIATTSASGSSTCADCVYRSLTIAAMLLLLVTLWVF